MNLWKRLLKWLRSPDACWRCGRQVDNPFWCWCCNRRMD